MTKQVFSQMFRFQIDRNPLELDLRFFDKENKDGEKSFVILMNAKNQAKKRKMMLMISFCLDKNKSL